MNDAPPNDDWFFVDAARQQQGPVSAEDLQVRYARGELRAYRLGPRIIRIRAEDFEAWCRPLDEADLLRIGR